MPEQNPNKILDLMKQKYGLSHISKTITISPSDTLFSIYRKTARYLYKNGMDNGDYGDKDEIIALSHQLEVPKEAITKVDSSNLVPEEKAAFVKLFKFKNTANDKWEDHIYQYLENGKRNYVFIKPNGSITPTYYGIRRFWKDTNKRIQDLASLNNYYSGENKQIAPWLTRAKDENEKVYFTAYSRDLLIGYDKLNTDIKKSFNQKLEHDTAFSSNKNINKRFATLIANLNNPKNGGKGGQYLFTADGSYDFFNKNSHTPSYNEWKKAENNTPLKVYVKDNDDQSKENITKELSKLLISNSDQDQMVIPKSSLQSFLANNDAIYFTTKYLKKTYNLTLQNQYDLNQAKSSHAKYFQTKKNIDKSTLAEMNKLSTELSAYFKKVEIDNDVDLNDLKKFIPELKDTLSVLPHSLDDTKPVLRFRKLKNHKALGMFTPINNTLAIDFRYNRDTKETGLQSFVHEYGHFLDYNYNKNGLPLSLSNAFSSSLQSSQSELENNQLTKKELTYLETPSEVFARAFETYASHKGLNNSTIKNKEIYNSKDVRFVTFTPEIRKKMFSYFDAQFPDMQSKIQQLYEQTKTNQATTTQKYRYYSKYRPINPGTYPTHDNKPLKIKNFDDRKNIGGNVKAWGYVEYPAKLSLEDQQNYDLMSDKSIQIAKELATINAQKHLNLTDITINPSNPNLIEYTVWKDLKSAQKSIGPSAIFSIDSNRIKENNFKKNISVELLNQQIALSKSKSYDPDFIKSFKNNVLKLTNKFNQPLYEISLSKAEMHRQAYLISRGRMKPTSDSKTMKLAKTFEKRRESEKSNTFEIILSARNNANINNDEFTNDKIENQLNRVFAKKIIKENKLASNKETLHRIAHNIAWNRAYNKVNHLDSSAQAGYAIEKKLFNNKEYKSNFSPKENKQNQIKNVSHNQDINLFQNQDLNM